MEIISSKFIEWMSYIKGGREAAKSVQDLE
jgi:hypothetical protein